MTEIKAVRFLFGWCKREEHDKCKGEKKVDGFHYVCTCKHHKNGGPDKVAA